MQSIKFFITAPITTIQDSCDANLGYKLINFITFDIFLKEKRHSFRLSSHNNSATTKWKTLEVFYNKFLLFTIGSDV
jgi:hypothetical protein